MLRLTLTTQNEESVLEKAYQVLRKGGLILYPTETMYGVGVDASNPEAVTRLLEYKKRPAGKAISVLVSSEEEAGKWVNLNATARNLYRSFLPGPLTVISESKGKVDKRLESELGRLGIRISSHNFALKLVQKYGKPITATSANASGKARPYSVETALSGLNKRQQELIDLIIEAGELPPSEPSTVIDTTQPVQEIIRAGAQMEAVSPPFYSSSETETRGYGYSLMKSVAHTLPEKTVIYALEGDLGAGKTQMAKGIAQAVGVETIVSSPTYTIMKEYIGEDKIRVYHIDCWRVPEIKPEELKFTSLIRPHSVIIIEWATPLLSYLKAQPEKSVLFRVLIEIKDRDNRVIKLIK